MASSLDGTAPVLANSTDGVVWADRIFSAAFQSWTAFLRKGIFSKWVEFQAVSILQANQSDAKRSMKVYFFHASGLARTLSVALDTSSCTRRQTCVVVGFAICSANRMIVMATVARLLTWAVMSVAHATA